MNSGFRRKKYVHVKFSNNASDKEAANYTSMLKWSVRKKSPLDRTDFFLEPSSMVHVSENNIAIHVFSPVYMWISVVKQLQRQKKTIYTEISNENKT